MVRLSRRVADGFRVAPEGEDWARALFESLREKGRARPQAEGESRGQIKCPRASGRAVELLGEKPLKGRGMARVEGCPVRCVVAGDGGRGW